MSEFTTNFHFIRPLWLIALVSLLFIPYFLRSITRFNSPWQQILPAHLSKRLLDIPQSSTNISSWRPLLIALLSILALAGPSWVKIPQPVFQVERGSVLIMDMSYSMYATDLLPNRLTRARFKASDLLETINEGDVDLIAYAGDAFTISPLTADVNNITLLLPSLSPDIMPELGSYPLAALELADKMLKDAGHLEGDIYWFTDGIENSDIQELTTFFRNNNHTINILGIGSLEGAPIKLTNGELLKDNSGTVIIPKLTQDFLEGVASRAGGTYQTIANNNSDINALIKQPSQLQANKRENQNNNLAFGDQWQEAGPYLLLLLIPLVLSYFRRGQILSWLPLGLLLFSSDPVSATTWQDLWKTKDQQGQEKFNQEEYLQAAQQFDNKQWQGSAYYKAKDYENALAAFKSADPQGKNADNLYNQGNSLAQLQRIDDAIAAYKKALEIDPEHIDAKENLKQLEALKKQQEQQEQENKDQNKDQNKEENKDRQNQNQNQNQGEQEQNNPSDKNRENQQGEQSEQSEDNQKKNQEKNQADKKQEENQQDQNQQDSQQKPSESKENDAQQQNTEQEQANAQQAQGEQTDDNTAAENKAEKANALSSQQAKLDQEQEEKLKQILNKVTDDPYLLIRNKMQLEYQKRQQEGRKPGVTKQW